MFNKTFGENSNETDEISKNDNYFHTTYNTIIYLYNIMVDRDGCPMDIISYNIRKEYSVCSVSSLVSNLFDGWII